MEYTSCQMNIDPQGRELIEHGSSLFPIAIYFDDIAERPVPWHWHEEFEAGIVDEGRAIVAIDSRKYTLEKGEAFFVNSEVLHGVWADGTSTCHLRSFCFHPRLVGGSFDSIFWAQYLNPLMSDPAFKGAVFSSSSLIPQVWQQVHQSEPDYEFEVRHTLSRLIVRLMRQRSEQTAFPSEKVLRDSARIKQMLAFIQTHYNEEITIDEIAQSASVSISEALRCFRSTIGTTPIRYVKQFRIEKAADLLSTTNLKIADIGMMCGFQEMSYFAKAFRSLKGVTPSKFREQRYK